MNNNSEHNINTELITKYLAKEASKEEIQLLDNWLKADIAHAEYFKECKKAFGKVC